MHLLACVQGVVVALTIPVVVSTTFILMYENGIYLHKVSLGALILALGLLVDDAIIVVEMMSVKLEEGWGHFRSATFAYQSTAFPMLSGTLITCAGFLPLALAEGMVAEFTKISIHRCIYGAHPILVRLCSRQPCSRL